MLCVCREREQTPRFAQPGSFEYEFGLKWKTLYQMLQEQQELLKKNFEDEVSKMEMDMEAALMEQHTAMLRQGQCSTVCRCQCQCHSEVLSWLIIAVVISESTKAYESI